MPTHILQLPPDASIVEKRIIEFAYAQIYRTLTDPLDKFIVAFMFDMGNTSEVTAVACGISRTTVWSRKKKIQKMLKSLNLSKKL